MPEHRLNVVTGEWVLFAEERANRPMLQERGEGAKNMCPFCPENAHMLPEETYRSADGRVVAVLNKYPAATTDGESGYGVHEVIVDTDAHEEQLHQFSIANVQKVIVALKERFVALSFDSRIQHVQIFKNQGKNAGASIPHSHWQIIALPFVSFTQQCMVKQFADNARCIICTETETADERIVYENALFTAFCPYAAGMSYEMMIVPKRHLPSIAYFSEREEEAFADMLTTTLCALHEILPEVSYNICLQNACVNDACQDMHFYAQIIPRNGNFAGFELATRSHINPVSPERAARVLAAAICAKRGEV